MRTKRIITIVIIVIAAIILIDTLVRLAGLASFVSGGITIRTQPSTEVFDTPGEARFDYDVLGPMLCSVTCNTTLVRHDTNTIVSEQRGTVILSGSISTDIENASSLKQVPVQLDIVCATNPTRYCQATKQSASDVTMARFSLSEDDANRREELLNTSASVEQRFETELETLSALAKLEAPYEELANRAASELDTHTTAIATFTEAIESENYAALEPETPSAIDAWREEQRAADRIANVSTRIARTLTLLSRYSAIDRNAYEAIDGTAREVLERLEPIEATLDANYDDAIERAVASAQDTYRTLSAACAVYGAPCITTDTNATTLEDAAALSERACDAAQAYDMNASKAQLTNLTLEDAYDAYNVTEYVATDDMIEAWSQGANLTLAQRLGAIIEVEARYCDQEAFTPLNVTLPNLSADEYDVELDVRGPHACVFGTCNVTRKAPILFIHGHSFSEGSDPLANLQTMTDLAIAFERYGYLYAGHLFPSVPDTETRIAAPVTFTASYYLNSYVEEGRIRLEAYKSEPIESYAIRLREDIEQAREITGSESVVLVAHSMGGLVARSYLDLFGDEHVDKLIMIGTPNHGVTDRVQRFCPVLGAGHECRDMAEGSVFLRKLNAKTPQTPMHVIAGTGCDEGDGIVELESVLLVGAGATIINGTCNGLDTLHAKLIDPEKIPVVVETIERHI